MLAAETILLIALGYVLCGVAVGVPFVLVGVGHVDPASRGAPVAFRLLILPGTIALWPFMALKWLRAPAQEAHA